MSKYYLSEKYIDRISGIIFGTVIICFVLLIVFFFFAIKYNTLESWAFFIPLFFFTGCGLTLNHKKLNQLKKFAKLDFVSVDLESALLIVHHFGDEKKYNADAIKDVDTYTYKNELDCISIFLTSGEKIKLRGYEKLQRLLFDVKELRKLNRSQEQ